MDNMMQFPKTVEEFMEEYKIIDTEQVYTNGAELVPIFRMKQWFDHIGGLPSAERHGRWIHNDPSGTSCSKCGSLFPMFMGLYDYCPNCGASMDEVTE